MCLIALIGLALPRFALFLMQLFTNKLELAMPSFIVGMLGFIFLPFTTLFYALCYAWPGGVSGIGWFIVVLGFLIDLTNWAGGGKAGRDRYATA